MKILKDKIKNKSLEVCVVGLGYVGLPVAVSFAKKYKVIGFDLNTTRVKQLKKSYDINNSIEKKDYKNLKKIKYTSSYKDLLSADVFIISTPTPILSNKKPDLKYVYKALDIFKRIKIKNKLVVLESTVYPNASEKNFIPYLEKITGKKIDIDFYYGYSPERINPGDKKNHFQNIDKIVAGSNHLSSNLVKKIYSSVVKKTHKATNIRTAEMSKIIENIQRDINIAFVNEISLICRKFNITSSEVLKLSNTKWNFLNFKPGLVGGHCLGVDPYYLIYELAKKNYKPKIVLSGRRINENYPKDILSLFLKSLNLKKIKKILFLGISYKANCNDIRNSKSLVILDQLISKKFSVDVYDPYFRNFKYNFNKRYNILSKFPFKRKYDSIIISVDHNEFKKIKISKIKKMCKKEKSIFDIKNIFPKENFFKI